jgi:hypothetical protein
MGDREIKRTHGVAWISALAIWAPSAVTAEPLNRVEVDSSASIGGFNSYYGGFSVTISPFAPFYESGFKLRFSASDTNYSYPGDLAKTFISKGSDIETSFLLGYGVQFNRWSLMLLAGPSAVWSHQMPGDSLFPSPDLTKVGAKIAVSVYATPTDQTMVYAQAGVSSVNSIYFTQAKFGGALWPSIYVGPEASVMGRVAVGGVQPMADQFSSNSFDITIQQWKVGAFISGLQVGPMTFGVSAGFLNDFQQGNGAYVSTSARTTF